MTAVDEQREYGRRIARRRQLMLSDLKALVWWCQWKAIRKSKKHQMEAGA